MMKKPLLITLLTLALGIPTFAQELPQDKIVPPRQHKEQVEPIEHVLQRFVALQLFIMWCTEDDGQSLIDFSPDALQKFLENVETQLKSSGKSKEELSAMFKALISMERAKQTEFAQEHHLNQEAWCKLQQKVWTAHGYGVLFEEEQK
ncbi:MAG TPA: hypothetical protein VEP90_06185 [Methylomirabilota bacterium]|nr:hypothetical protein [Methylomirabilota bacterium]